MKTRLFVTLLIAFISITGIAQQVKLEYEPLFPMPKDWKNKNWVIVNVDNDEIVAYRFIAGSDFTKPKMNFVRFTKDFQIKSEGAVKLDGVVKDLHVSDSKIHLIVENPFKSIYTALDIHSLQVVKSEVLFEKSSSEKVYVRWSPNSKYMAVLSIFDGNFMISSKLRGYRLNRLFLYNNNLQEMNRASVDAFDITNLKLGEIIDKTEHYNPDMIITDEGKIVYASLRYACYPALQFEHKTKKDNPNPEFGEGTKLVVNILNKDKLNTYDFGKVDLERRIDLPTILFYNGKEVLLSGIGMTLISCNLNSKTYTILCDNKNWGHDGKGKTTNTLYKVHNALSKSTDTGEYGYIVWGDKVSHVSRDPNIGVDIMNRTFSDFYWINKDGSNYVEGSIGNFENNAGGNKLFKIDITGSKKFFSFYYNGSIYWFAMNYAQKGWKSSGYSQKYLLKDYNRQGELHEKEISDIDLENSSFYQIDDTHFLIWQQNIKKDKEYMQRLGLLSINEK